jgi:pimeloyl-ACP methyl ester carboxylesterase
MWVTALFEIPGLGALVQRRRGIIRWFLTRDARKVWPAELIDVYAAPTARNATAGQRMHAAFVVRDIARLALRRDHRRPFETPTMVITGDQDRYIPPSLIADPTGRVRTRVVSGGHFLLDDIDDNPDPVTDAIRAWLSQTSALPGLDW